MSISALESLRMVELLDSRDRVVDLSRVEPAILQQKINYYHKDRLRNAEHDIASRQDWAVVVSSISARNEITSLLPSGFVYNHIYANDPLSPYRETDEFSEGYKTLMGMHAKVLPDPLVLQQKLSFFEQAAPIIRCGLLSVLPIEEIHSPPEERPIYFPKDGFRSAVPEHLHDFIHQSSKLNEVLLEGGHILIKPQPPKKPTRGISISFADDDPVKVGPFYLLMDKEFERIDETKFRIRQRLNWDSSPGKEQFETWAYQCVNSAIIARLDSVGRELNLAAKLGATYLTESRFESTLFGMSSDDADGGQVRAVNFLKANAPYLKSSPTMLARLRTDNPKLFDRWQHSLLAVAHELTGCEPSVFEDRSKQLFETEVRPQLDELNQSLTKIGLGFGGAGLLTVGSIGLALVSNALPVAAALGLGAMIWGGRALPTVSEYLSKRRGPAFVWSKLAE